MTRLHFSGHLHPYTNVPRSLSGLANATAAKDHCHWPFFIPLKIAGWVGVEDELAWMAGYMLKWCVTGFSTSTKHFKIARRNRRKLAAACLPRLCNSTEPPPILTRSSHAHLLTALLLYTFTVKMENSEDKNSSGDEIANVLVNDDIAHT